MIVCDQSILEHIASFAPRTEKPAAPRGTFDLDAFVSRNLGGTVTKEGPWNGGYRWELNPCPFNPDHTDRAAYIVRMADGAIGAGCWHDGCRSAGNDWHKLRDMFEPKSERQSAASVTDCQSENKKAPPVPTVDLVTFTLPELMRQQFPPVRWIIRDIWPEGLGIMGGKAKIGKTYLGLNVALACAAGGMALGGIKVERMDVLYLALEDGEELLQDRCRQLLRGQPAPASFHYAILSPTMDVDGITVLEQWLKDHDETRLVFVDTLKRVRPRGNGRRNAYDEDYEAIAPLADLAHRRRISIMAMHHLTKTPSVDDPFDELSGSMGVQATPDTLMVLRGVRGKADAVMHVIGRRIREQLDIALKRDAETGQWNYLGDAEGYQTRRERIEIMEAIEEFGEPMQPRDIAALLDKNPNTIRVLLRKMVRDNEVPTPKSGNYSTFRMQGIEAINTVNSVNSPDKSAYRMQEIWRQDAEKDADEGLDGVVYESLRQNWRKQPATPENPHQDAKTEAAVYGLRSEHDTGNSSEDLEF